MEFLGSIHPKDDPHLEIKLLEKIPGAITAWKASAVGMGIITVTFELCMVQHCQESDVFWVWNWTTLGARSIFIPAVDGRFIRRPRQSVEPSSGKMAELFGGFTGWSVAAEFMGLQVAVVVEAKVEVAEAAAVAYGWHVQHFEQVWSQFLQHGDWFEPSIWIADVRDPRVWTLMSLIGIQHGCASPPCPPWCGMASKLGLQSPDGMVFAQTIRMARDLGFTSLSLENARGIKQHPHFEAMMRFAVQLGFNLVLSTNENCTGVLPLNRCRWLGCLVSHVACIMHVQVDHIRAARALSLPNDPFLGGLRGCQSIATGLSHDELEELQLTPETIQILSDPQLLPEWWAPGKKLDTPDAVFRSRITAPHAHMQGLVASYGKQHEFRHGYLAEKGLCTTVFQGDQGPRYFSPWEQASALGLPATIRIPQDIKVAWHIMGNALSIAHGLLQLSRTHVLLGAASPFGLGVPPLPTLCRMMQRKMLRLTGKTQIMIDGYKALVDNDMITPMIGPIWPANGQDLTHAVEAHEVILQGDEIPEPARDDGDTEPEPSEEDKSPFHKIRRIDTGDISPTVPYQVELEGEGLVSVDAPKFLGGFQSFPAASIGDLENMMGEFSQTKVSQQDGSELMPFCLSSLSHRWVCIGWGPDDLSVWDMFVSVMPHMCTNLVDRMGFGETCFAMSSIPIPLPFRIVQFRPLSKICCVFVPHLNRNIAFEADVTTTVGSMLAHFSGTLKVPVHSIVLSCMGKRMNCNDFILNALDWSRFDISWVPTCLVVPKSVLNPEDNALNDFAVNKQVAVATHPAVRVRFVAKHPLWGTVRTVATHKKVCLRDVVSKMFPDIGECVAMQVAHKDRCFDGSVTVQQIQEGNLFFVELGLSKPWPCIVLEVVPEWMMQTSSQQDFHVKSQFKREVQSPFSLKRDTRSFSGDTSLQVIGGAFFLECESPQTIQVLINNKLVDPTLKVRETPRDSAIVFRCTPLPGGAKGEVHGVLSKTLVKRGVEQANVDARIKTILASIPIDEIKPHCKEDDSQFWNSLKQLANQHRVRLVTNGELKEFQKNNRQNKRDKPSSSTKGENVKGHGKGKGSKSGKGDNHADLSRVKIELQYLKAADNTALHLLTKDMFGEDKTGVTLMSSAEVKNLLPVRKLSPGPLAILAVTSPKEQPEQVTMMPAVDAQGEPILLPVVIYNFGDVEVSMKGSAKPVITQQVPTQVIEVFIRRHFIKDWSLARDNLNYLGKVLTGMPEGTLVAHWAFKAYDDKKKIIPFDKAAYIHGFIRIKTSHVDNILKASGKCGVFLVPKDETRRPDPAFMVIPAGPEKLEHLLLQVQKTSLALGIVEYSGGFAYRCRREHCQTVRRALAPNSLWSEEGQMRSGDTLWVLKFVKVNTGPPQLTASLKELGWDAEAIRPLGPTTWSIAAAGPPPAPHLALDGSFAIAMPANQPVKRELGAWTQALKIPPTVVAVDSSTEADEMDAETTTSTRISEMKSELTEHVDRMIQQRLKPTQDHVETLTSMVKDQEAKNAEFQAKTIATLTNVHEHQQAVDVRMGTLEGTVAGVSQNVITQMNGMLQTMQNALISRLDALENGEGAKRQRKDGDL